eukprot:GHVS01012332.1.p1 GENE.GHVS01012332.1~~GHVS01012332.1.p1  ORF type:complete len:119 (+),score=0.91 GHVS01012332.1:71-427(+)
MPANNRSARKARRRWWPLCGAQVGSGVWIRLAREVRALKRCTAFRDEINELLADYNTAETALAGGRPKDMPAAVRTYLADDYVCDNMIPDYSIVVLVSISAYTCLHCVGPEVHWKYPP